MMEYILYIILGVAALMCIILLTVKLVKKRKAKKNLALIEQEKTEKNLEVVNDVRYTVEENPVEENGEMNTTFVEGDLMLSQNTPYKVSQYEMVKPGKYILISTDPNMSAFNVRVGIYVREYRHNQEIVLAEGDTVCAVSCNIILR